MPMWLCRAGRYGEFENKFLEDNRVYCTWDNLTESIMQFHTKQDLQQYLSLIHILYILAHLRERLNAVILMMWI